jgi:hypothetical protein
MPKASSSYETVLPPWEAKARFEPLWGRHMPAVVTAEPQAEEPAPNHDAIYRRGFEDGQASAEGSYSSALTLAKQTLQAELSNSLEERLAESARELAGRVGERLSSFEAELREAVARALGPIISKQISHIEQRALLSEIDRIIELDGLAAVRISGPESYLGILNAAMLDRGLAVTAEVNESLDVTVALNEVELKSRLPEWVKKLEAVIG